MGGFLQPKALVLLQLSLLSLSCLTIHGDPVLEPPAPSPQPHFSWGPFPFPCNLGPTPAPLPEPLHPRHLASFPPIPGFEPPPCPPGFPGGPLPSGDTGPLPPSEIIIPPLPSKNTHFVAVQGVVYCKSCNKVGGRVDSPSGASPLRGAVVKVQCNNVKHPFMQEAATDEDGKFYIQAPTTFSKDDAHKCKVFIVSSPLEKSCSVATDLNGGLNGADLIHMEEKPPQYNLRTRLANFFVTAKPLDANDPNSSLLKLSQEEKPLTLFTVGPFAFESADGSSQCTSP
ncbi:pistil-specific extensin-like protein [Malania oleifera]|uniref:pistil-specific extensin-like protein n=1 Tax=Malania oleifera TaxID=397392 RepID=UPI0025AEC6E4|nr:pistil-specific extensin-like protein [Malania oleifera]